MADEKKIEALEALFPQISGSAFTNAHDQALLAGVSVLLASDGVIYEVFPGGHRERVKEIKRPIPVVPGSTVILK